MNKSIATKRRLNYQAVRELVGCHVNGTKPGEALPSIRDMMNEGKCSQALVYRALEHYIRKGTIQIIPKSGIFKSGCNGSAGKIIDVVACHEIGYMKERKSYYPEMLEYLHDSAAGMQYAIRLHRVNEDDPLEKYNNIAKLDDSGGFVLLAVRLTEIVNIFKSTGKPLVCAFPQTILSGVSMLNDSEQLVELQMEHLIGLGHSRIAYPISDIDVLLTPRQRLTTYYRIMAEHGFKCYPHWVRSFDYCKDKGNEQSIIQMFTTDPHPTAVVVQDYFLPVLYRVLDRLGLKVGSDVAVVATDGMPVTDMVSPTATTIVNPRDQAAELLWRLLRLQMNGDRAPQCKELTFRLRQGRSTFPLKEIKSFNAQKIRKMHNQ